MNEFLENLKREATANPTLTLGVAAALLASASKLIDAVGSLQSKRAYAHMAENIGKRTFSEK